MSAVYNISVVIPAKNEAGFIGACVASINALCNEVFDVKVILVDNGSTDETARIAEGLGAPVLKVPQASLGALRNIGAKAADGRFVAFVDADCTVDPGWARGAMNVLDDDSVAATGSYPGLPDSSQTWVQRIWSYIARRPVGEPAPVSWLPTANLVVDAERFRAVDGFNGSMQTAEDADLCYRLSKLGTIIYSDEVSVRHHREPSTLRQFFSKEVWHGMGSYEGLTHRRFTLAELPSLVAPLMVWTGWFLVAVGLLAFASRETPTTFLLGLALTLVVPFSYAVRKLLQSPTSPRCSLQVLVLYTAYHFARAISLVRWLTTAASRKSSSAPATTPTR